MGNVETRVCPICNEDNNCMHNKNCWCMEKKVPEELIKMLPLEKRGKSCICENCIDAFNQKKR